MDFSAIKSITIPEGNVTQIAVGSKVLWKSGPLPSAYQQVEWIRGKPISASSGAYLDLGFAFDTAAVIHLNFIRHESNGQPFGAAENSGKYRCMVSQNTNTYYYIYGSTGSAYVAEYIDGLGQEVDLVYTLKKGVLKAEDLITGKVTSADSQNSIAAFTMTRNLYLFAQNYNTAARFAGQYSFKSFQYYDKNNTLICDLIPCYRKSDGVIGMYDIVRKIFLTNAGSGSFTKGADV